MSPLEELDYRASGRLPQTAGTGSIVLSVSECRPHRLWDELFGVTRTLLEQTGWTVLLCAQAYIRLLQRYIRLPREAAALNRRFRLDLPPLCVFPGLLHRFPDLGGLGLSRQLGSLNRGVCSSLSLFCSKLGDLSTSPHATFL